MYSKAKQFFTNSINRVNVTLFVLMAMVVPAFAQSDTIEIDSGLFIEQINIWLIMAMGIVAIGVGISGAFALSKMVGRMIVDALNGRM